jgi:hypothetical protein
METRNIFSLRSTQEWDLGKRISIPKRPMRVPVLDQQLRQSCIDRQNRRKLIRAGDIDIHGIPCLQFRQFRREDQRKPENQYDGGEEEKHAFSSSW